MIISLIPMSVYYRNENTLTDADTARALVDEVVPWWVAAAARWGTSTLQYVFNNVGEGDASYQL